MHAHPLEARIAHVEGAFNQVNERLGSIERRLDGIDVRFNWLTGIVVGTWITTILTILLHH
ncbi:MAG: hypothetical protein JO113_07980 [Candidatus Eremiobacteraeota bacterium]|nr:hypothetical protein [Candidatus Eremiobacteraeota bacterium]